MGIARSNRDQILALVFIAGGRDFENLRNDQTDEI